MLIDALVEKEAMVIEESKTATAAGNANGDGKEIMPPPAKETSRKKEERLKSPASKADEVEAGEIKEKPEKKQKTNTDTNDKSDHDSIAQSTRTSERTGSHRSSDQHQERRRR